MDQTRDSTSNIATLRQRKSHPNEVRAARANPQRRSRQPSRLALAWIIVRVSDYHWLPARPTKRGYTHDEPTAHGLPRLFTSYSAAHLALRQWLLGPLEVGYPTGDQDQEPTLIRGQMRDTPMKIIQISLNPLE